MTTKTPINKIVHDMKTYLLTSLANVVCNGQNNSCRMSLLELVNPHLLKRIKYFQLLCFLLILK